MSWTDIVRGEMENFIKHKSLVEQIVQGMEKKILDGAFQPGERIIESAICESLGVSRSPVREAFRILESEGFITSEARKGISVALITTEEIKDIYLIRANIEALAVSLAVEKQNPAVLEKMKKLHEQMVRVAENNNIKAYFSANLKFHEALIGACENRRLIQLINTFVKQTMRYRLEVLSLPGWIDSSVEAHRAIIESFEAGDAEEAGLLRKNTILSHMERLLQNIKEREENQV